MRPRFSEPAIGLFQKKFYFLKQVLCEDKSLLVFKKFTFVKVLYFLKGLVFKISFISSTKFYTHIYKFDISKQVLYFAGSIFVSSGMPYSWVPEYSAVQQ
jgi:hypothetical protein